MYVHSPNAISLQTIRLQYWFSLMQVNAYVILRKLKTCFFQIMPDSSVGAKNHVLYTKSFWDSIMFGTMLCNKYQRQHQLSIEVKCIYSVKKKYILSVSTKST